MTTMDLSDLEESTRRLIDAARKARDNAHAPYSGFSVGAALLAGGGAVFPGCNVEISSDGLTMCAERVALFAAKAAGVERLEMLAVVGPGRQAEPTPPCGACRQVIWDLAGDIPIYLAAPGGRIACWRASELLPNPFGPEHLAESSAETTGPHAETEST